MLANFQNYNNSSFATPSGTKCSLLSPSVKHARPRERSQTQPPGSVAPNVGVENPSRQTQSPLHTSTGGTETMNEKQKVNNKESVTLRKPWGGYRNPWENGKSTTKSLPPLAGGSNPGKTESPQQRVGHPCKPAGGSRNPWENGKSTTNSPSRNPKTLKETPSQD